MDKIIVQHTPGPWKLTGSSGRMITTEKSNYGFIADVDTLANAKLIAAAPELLESLEDLLKDYENTDFDVVGKSEKLIKKAKAAINKATK